MKTEMITGTLAVMTLAGVCVAAPSPMDERYAAVWSPVAVATPPTFAHRAMTETASGQIRHYGRIWIAEKAHRAYVSSDNRGLDWKTCVTDDPDELGAMTKCPWADYWLGFEYDNHDGGGLVLPRLAFTNKNDVAAVRSPSGPGTRTCEVSYFCFADKTRYLGWLVRNPIPLTRRRRWLGIANLDATGERRGGWVGIALSDDEGVTWRVKAVEPNLSCGGILKETGDRGLRWENYTCEGTALELNDGTVLLAVRTSLGNHWLYRSADGGETWSGPERLPMFHAVNTMPLLHRLADGRILFVWNNAEPLPERDHATVPELNEWERKGVGEDVFTNRDVLHAAISSDEGRTWRGFRELYLNPTRERADFRTLGNGLGAEIDKSVHQTQALNLPDGKVLLALGQNPCARRMIMFDPDWLLETSRHEDFRRDALANVSSHLFVRSLSGGARGWAGHCAWNRTFGAMPVPDPDDPHRCRECLQLCRVTDPRLVSDRQGVVWNFPSAEAGEVTLACAVKGAGFRLSLLDRWINPSDETVSAKAAFSEPVDKALVGEDWHDLKVTWGGGSVRLVCEGKTLLERTAEIPSWGLSYLHVQTLAEGTDAKGTLFRSLDMKANAER